MRSKLVLHSLGKVRRHRLLVSVCVAAVVALALLMSLLPLAFVDAISFPDVPSSHPYYTAIIDLATRSIIGGFPDGTFGPARDVSRQQFAKMAVLTGGYPVSEANVCSFTDVANGGAGTFYPDNYIAVCAANGITTGKTPTTFDPTGSITRYQLLSMVVRMTDNLHPGLLATPPAGFTGTAGWGADPTHGANAVRAEYNGLLDGIPLGTLSPTGNATRGEVAQVLHNLLLKMTPAPGWESQDGAIAPGSGPAVASWGPNHLDVFVRGADNALYWKVWDGSAWGSWTKIAGALTSDPAAVSWGPGRIDVFVRGPYDHLWHIAYASGTWGAWQDLGGILTSAPAACTSGAGALGVAYRGVGNVPYALIGDGTTFSAHVPLPGVINSAPACVVSAPGTIDLFGTGFDYKMYHARWSGGTWSTFESIGGVCISGPGVSSWGGGHLDVFVRSADNFIYQKTFDGAAWGDWTKISGALTFQGDPDAVAWGPNRIDLFAVGADYHLYHKAWTGSQWVDH